MSVGQASRLPEVCLERTGGRCWSAPHRRVCGNRSGSDKQSPPREAFFRFEFDFESDGFEWNARWPGFSIAVGTPALRLDNSPQRFEGDAVFEDHLNFGVGVFFAAGCFRVGGGGAGDHADDFAAGVQDRTT